MQSLRSLCQYIIQHETNNERIVTNMRLQKLLYFIQAQCLVNEGRPYFSEEIQAWKYGPVVPVIYDIYKFFGSLGIIQPTITEISPLVPDASLRITVNQVLGNCKDITTGNLVEISHQQAPWKNAYNEGLGYRNPITIDAIRDYFCKG